MNETKPCGICGIRDAVHTSAIMYHNSLFATVKVTYICRHCGDKMDLTPGIKTISNGRKKFVQFYHITPDKIHSVPNECDECHEVYFESSMYWSEDGNYIYCLPCHQKIDG